jgi:hypothetical protein
MKVYRTQYLEVGDLVISHTKTLARAKPGRPALVIATSMNPSGSQQVRLKVGEVEWWDWARRCEKVPE